jgi:site-specific DNA-methyltransferase (adenine-specific)/adenine-specific DNA-methyltransferase
MNDEQRQDLIRRLRQGEELSPEWARILFPPEKREYELVYHGKEREEDIVASTLAVPLQKMRTFGRNGDEWHNMLIFGDNLQVMKSLLEMKKDGRLCNADGTSGVRLVYIDPPFATKQDFRGTQEQKAYQDKVAGAEFLEFLRKRLVFIRELLSDDGALYLHLDPKKAHYAKTLADEVFGEARFRNEIIWPCTNAHNETKQYGRIHQVVFFYTKDKNYLWDPQRVPFSEAQLRRYKKDAKGRLYTCQDLTAERRNSNSGKFDWRGTFPSEGRGWGYELDQLERWWVQGRIARKRDGTPRQDGLIVYLDETEGQTPQSIWADVPRIANTSAERIDYPTQKPEALLERIVKTSSRDGDIVLDCFMGSGTAPAVAEKLGRRWIGIDCGKLSIYTVQKRMLNLRKEIGNKGVPLTPKPFALFNAGLYDFSKLKELPWDSWRFFALQLFQCRDESHQIGGIQLDGYFKGSSVLLFNHQKQPGVRIDEETIQSIHDALGSKVGSRLFIVAPALVFDFQQDYLTLDAVRYYALRIPYSIIHELHQREFAALRQPADELAVNDTVDAVGFDFVRRPELEYEAGANKRKGELIEEGFIRIKTFKSEAVVREPIRKKANRETLSMVMLDYDFDRASDVFDLDAVFYAEAIEKANWEVRFPVEAIGHQVMAVFVDIYGNEAREVILANKFGVGKAVTKSAKRTKKTGK